jgi:hypothetical protein
MRIAIDPTQTKLAVLDGETLKLYDVSGAAPRELASLSVAGGRWLAGCDAYAAVLAGKLAPAGASVRSATVVRIGWDGSELSSLSVGEVERRGLSFDAAGARLVVTDWAKCRVTLFDATSGKRIAAAGRSIPSGASLSRDGSRIIAGTADQGNGAILFFDAATVSGDELPIEALLPPKPSPGLDDAPYFSVWSPDQKLAALSNQSWGGRGVFVYDMQSRRPLWSLCLREEDEIEPEEWYPQPMAFASSGSVLLVAEPGAIRGYRARDGKDVGAVRVENGNGEVGFAVQDLRRRLWLPGPVPKAYDFSASWVASDEGKKGPTAKVTAKKGAAATKTKKSANSKVKAPRAR